MNQSKTKLLFIVNVDWFFFSHRLPVALGALRTGYEVHVATSVTNPRYKNMLKDFGFSFHEISIDRRGKNIFAFFRAFHRTRSYNLGKYCSHLFPLHLCCLPHGMWKC